MVKLIRLASQDNCNFMANFSNDILVPPGSKLALQNVSFKTEFKTFVITEDNHHIQFTADMNRANRDVYLESKTYSGVIGYNDFLEDLEIGLNGTLSVYQQESGDIFNSVYGDFYIPRPNRKNIVDDHDFTTINFRYATVVTPWGPTFTTGMTNPGGTKNVACFMERPVYDDFFVKTPENIADNIIALDPSVSPSINQEYNQVSKDGFHLSKGSAIYMTRIGAYADNGSGLDDNGAAIGLTNTNLGLENWGQTPINIPGTMRDYEIRFNRATENYKYINNNGFEKNSGVLPKNVNNTDGENNDIIFFIIGQAPDGIFKIKGGVWQEGPTPDTNIEHIFFDLPLEREARSSGFYPYLYIRDASIKLMGTSFSLSNFIEGNGDYKIAMGGVIGAQTRPNDYDFFEESGDSGINPTSELIPLLNENRYKATSAYTSRLYMHKDVWEIVGVSKFPFNFNTAGYTHITYKIISDGNYQWWARFLADQLAQFNLDDNFIVEVLGMSLDCYDASESDYSTPNLNYLLPKQGRRKNILMTLPTNDNNNGLVQYETNNPVYIDLINKAPVLLRSIQVKILRKDFSPVSTLNNISLLTLLLDVGR